MVKIAEFPPQAKTSRENLPGGFIKEEYLRNLLRGLPACRAG